MRRWIDMVHEPDSLCFDSVKEAFNFCKEHLRNPGAVNSCETFPRSLNNGTNQRLQTFSHCSGAGVSQAPEQQEAWATREVVSSIDASVGEQNGDSILDLTGLPSGTTHHENSSHQVSSVGDTARRSLQTQVNQLAALLPRTGRALLRDAQYLMDTAKNETVYFMLHFVLDDTRRYKFGLFSKLSLDQWESEGRNPSELITEILTYAICKLSGREDNAEQESREAELRATAALLDRVRIRLSTPEHNLPLYRDRIWDYSDSQSEENGF